MNSKILNAVVLIVLAVAGNFVASKMFNVPRQMEAVLILGAVVALPVIRYPLMGVYLLFITTPFIPLFRRLYYLLYGRPKIDPLIMTSEFILVLIFAGLFFEFRSRRGADHDIRGYTFMVGAYFFYMVLRTFVHTEVALADAVTIFKFYGPAVLLFFVGMVYSNRMTHLKALWGVTFGIGVFAAVYGLKQLYVGYSEAERIWFTSVNFTSLFINGVVRPFSVFQAPVAFADYLLLAAIGALMLWSWRPSDKRIYLLVLLPVLFYGALITSVRSNWIGMLATFALWYFLVNVHGKRRRLALLIALGMAYVAYEFIAETFGAGMSVDTTASALSGKLMQENYAHLLIANRTSAITNPLQEHSLLSRMVLWKTILQWSTDPLTGLLGKGLGAQTADSMYFTYLAQFGYPGVALILTVLFSFISAGFRVIDKTKDRDLRLLAQGVTIMNIVFAIMSITGSHIHSFPGDAYFWFWNGVLIRNLPPKERGRRKAPGDDTAAAPGARGDGGGSVVSRPTVAAGVTPPDERPGALEKAAR